MDLGPWIFHVTEHRPFQNLASGDRVTLDLKQLQHSKMDLTGCEPRKTLRMLSVNAAKLQLALYTGRSGSDSRRDPQGLAGKPGSLGFPRCILQPNQTIPERLPSSCLHCIITNVVPESLYKQRALMPGSTKVTSAPSWLARWPSSHSHLTWCRPRHPSWIQALLSKLFLCGDLLQSFRAEIDSSKSLVLSPTKICCLGCCSRTSLGS